MNILKNVSVPTGNILVVEGEKGKLECLSLGDYGKDHNIKADFLGLSRDLDQVVHTDLMPLEEKWVITISTQYGCSMNCSFCDVPKVGKGKNATKKDIIDQVKTAMSLHPEITKSNRLNIHFARMGEPTWNWDVIAASYDYLFWDFKQFNVHPVISTMMPRKNKELKNFINSWMLQKNWAWNGNAGLQLSINSTDENERQKMFSNNALSLKEISEMMSNIEVVGRKITLNFAVADYTIDAKVLIQYFDPERFLVKLTPMHKTIRCIDNGIKTAGDYTTIAPYLEHEKSLKAEGFDVLVFVASKEEDESRITCGNCIMALKGK